jgi:DUF4097 and DUF4098 domain-containing protein YvlB
LKTGQSKIGLTAMLFGALLLPQARGEQWSKHWSVGAKPELRVHAGDAAVVVQAENRDGIDATLTTRGWSIGRTGVQVTEHQSGNSVDIDIKVPPTHFNFGEHSIKLEVRVPRELTGDIHTGDGSIKLLGLHGSVRADTGDGSIQGQDLDGSLEARSGDGSVHVTGRFDRLQLHTQDGSVELNVQRGSRMQAGWRVETGDGSVRVNLPRDLAMDLELHTGDGHLRVDLPLSVEGVKSDHELRGKLNGGGPPLVVHTGDGSISIGAV